MLKAVNAIGSEDFHKKAVFFDADGTICDIEKGTPASAVEAITKLVENGHEAWLCTGRSRAFVPDYLEQIPFTGMISACGCTIEKNGERLFNKEMTTQEAWRSVEVLRKYGMVPVMEGADWMYYDKDGDYYEFIGHVGEGLAGDTIEMIPRGFSKAVGIAAVCRIFNIAHEDTIVFGDSNNDLSMFEYAKTKVAMGNAAPGIKKLADYVTTDIFHYGIKNGLEHLGLI